MLARSGQAATTRDAIEWAREATERGAGEILLTSIDRDGTKAGFDCEMTAAVSDAVNIPVIASGGAGTFEHFANVFREGHADAALAASMYRKARLSAGAAWLGAVSFLQLDAERGRICVAGGRGDLIIVVVAEPLANVGLIRVELLKALESLG